MGINKGAGETTRIVSCHRVIINADGEALRPDRAESEHGITPDIVFIRYDGWGLGARECDRSVAYRMSPDEWTHFFTIADRKLRPIEEYTAYSLTNGNQN